jgi:hypothetical protein
MFIHWSPLNLFLDENRSTFIESNLPEKGNPSSKRRRIGGEMPSDTPALHMAPHSDDIIPSSGQCSSLTDLSQSLMIPIR